MKTVLTVLTVSTIGLNSYCRGFKRCQLVRFSAKRGQLRAVSGNNLSRINKLGVVSISDAQIDAAPTDDVDAYDYYASLLGTVTRDSETAAFWAEQDYYPRRSV